VTIISTKMLLFFSHIICRRIFVINIVRVKRWSLLLMGHPVHTNRCYVGYTHPVYRYSNGS